MKRINIGSGICAGSLFEKDWINVDFGYDPNKPEWHSCEYMDFNIESRWPLEDNSADCIFASHVFEHIFYEKLFGVIQECYRVLKDGLPIRIICPDPRIFINNWQADNKQFMLDSYGKENWDRNDYGNKPHIGFTDMFFGDNYDHHLIISIDILKIMLIRAGFNFVTEMAYGNTEFPQYFGTNQPDEYGKTVDNRPSMSYYLEAIK